MLKSNSKFDANRAAGAKIALAGSIRNADRVRAFLVLALTKEIHNFDFRVTV
jgi:hypothetical protein